MRREVSQEQIELGDTCTAVILKPFKLGLGLESGDANSRFLHVLRFKIE